MALRQQNKSRELTLSLLPLPQDGVQPLLLVLGVFGHADEPLVLRRVVDLPAVGHRVVVAVVVGCRATTNREKNIRLQFSAEVDSTRPLYFIAIAQSAIEHVRLCVFLKHFLFLHLIAAADSAACRVRR